MARPTKLTPAVQEHITNAIRMGAAYTHAAQFGGITYNAMRNWILRGEAEIKRREGRVKEGSAQWEKEQPYVEFFHNIKKAEADAVVRWLGQIETAAKDGTWQAAAWKAERRYPDEYGRQKISHEHTGKVKLDVTQLSDEELQAIVDG